MEKMMSTRFADHPSLSSIGNRKRAAKVPAKRRFFYYDGGEDSKQSTRYSTEQQQSKRLQIKSVKMYRYAVFSAS